MTASLCLVLPLNGLDQGFPARLQWLVDVGETLDPERPIARLFGPRVVDVRPPEGISGTLGSRLIEDGMNIGPGEPWLTFIPQNEVGTRRRPPGAEGRTKGLAEDTRTFASHDDRWVVVAEVTDMKRLRPIALVGLIFLLGMATNVIATVLHLFLGGFGPLLVGVLALSAVALALIYGEQHLESHDGFPS